MLKPHLERGNNVFHRCDKHEAHEDEKDYYTNSYSYDYCYRYQCVPHVFPKGVFFLFTHN